MSDDYVVIVNQEVTADSGEEAARKVASQPPTPDAEVAVWHVPKDIDEEEVDVWRGRVSEIPPSSE